MSQHVTSQAINEEARSSCLTSVSGRPTPDIMKFLAVLTVTAFVAVAQADVSHILGQAHHLHHEHAQYQANAEAQAAILKVSAENPGTGSYAYGFETQNGIKAEESGVLKKAASKDYEDSVVAQGSYSYTAPDGAVYTVQYIADENGYQPQGAHLPQAPEIPQAILASLQYNAAHPEQN